MIRKTSIPCPIATDWITPRKAHARQYPTSRAYSSHPYQARLATSQNLPETAMTDMPDLESRAAPEDHHALRLWLRMLTCCNLIESEIRSRLRTEFDTTLPRFDLMAQLQRAPKGMKMGELSRHMMVTNGNITGITDQLEKEGLVIRTKSNPTAAAPCSNSLRKGKRASRAWRARTSPGSNRCSAICPSPAATPSIKPWANSSSVWWPDSARTSQATGACAAKKAHNYRHDSGIPSWR